MAGGEAEACATPVRCCRADRPRRRRRSRSRPSRPSRRPGRVQGLCSTVKEDCLTAGCCRASSHRCIRKSETGAQDARCCPSSGPCTGHTEALDSDIQESTPMYCTIVHVEDNGSPEKIHDKELLSGEYEREASIFGCEAYAVCSDVETSPGGLETNELEEVDGDWKIAKRELTGEEANSGVFYQAWKASRAAGVSSSFDWTVKTEALVVPFPKKPVLHTHLLPVPLQGDPLQSCLGEDFGFFGSSEVFSKSAFSIFHAKLETSRRKGKTGVENGKYGPIGGVLFAQTCMQERISMYYPTVHVEDNGSQERTYDKELLSGEYGRKASIFGYEAYAVYSEAYAVYSSFDWTTKADADVVPFPKRPVPHTHLLPVQPQGASLQSCPEVDYGFFGSPEVFSKSAYCIFLAKLETSRRRGKIGVKNGKYGPIGGDLFAQICMQKNGVAIRDTLDISPDGLCRAKKLLDREKTLRRHVGCTNTHAPAHHPVKHTDKYSSGLELAAPLMNEHPVTPCMAAHQLAGVHVALRALLWE